MLLSKPTILPTTSAMSSSERRASLPVFDFLVLPGLFVDDDAFDDATIDVDDLPPVISSREEPSMMSITPLANWEARL